MVSPCRPISSQPSTWPRRSITWSLWARGPLSYLSVRSWLSYSCPRRTPRADQIIKRLIDFVVRRGILVTVAQITSLIVYLAQPDGLYWTLVYFCTSRIYVTTMSESYLWDIEMSALTLFVCLKSLCEYFFHIYSCVLIIVYQAEWQRGHETKWPRSRSSYDTSRLVSPFQRSLVWSHDG